MGNTGENFLPSETKIARTSRVELMVLENDDVPRTSLRWRMSPLAINLARF